MIFNKFIIVSYPKKKKSQTSKVFTQTIYNLPKNKNKNKKWRRKVRFFVFEH